jgi:hypothetical protein
MLCSIIPTTTAAAGRKILLLMMIVVLPLVLRSPMTLRSWVVVSTFPREVVVRVIVIGTAVTVR